MNQNGPIEGPPNGLKWPIDEELVFKLFPLVVHMYTGTPGFYVRAQHDPEKNVCFLGSVHDLWDTVY